MKKTIAALISIVAIVFPQAAIANGFITTTAGIKRFIFTGLATNSAVAVRIQGWPRDKATVPNACGLTVIAPSTGASIMLIAFANSNPIDVAALPVQTVPACSAGVLAEPRTANFKTSTGSVVLVGQAAGTARVIQDITRNLKTDGCGIAKLTPPKQSFPNGWWFEGTSFTPAGGSILYADDMLGNEEKSICKTVGTQKIKYIPLTP